MKYSARCKVPAVLTDDAINKSLGTTKNYSMCVDCASWERFLVTDSKVPMLISIIIKKSKYISHTYMILHVILVAKVGLL